MSHVRQKEKENRHLNMDKNGSSNLWKILTSQNAQMEHQ